MQSPRHGFLAAAESNTALGQSINFGFGKEISIGDYVLSGGELAAMVVIDGLTRMIPGALGAEDGAKSDSFSRDGASLEGPQYTRPREFRGMKVPEVLLSGNHKAIAEWREQQALRRTRDRRPELLGEDDTGVET